MNLSTRGRYGLRAMCELAKARDQGPLSLSTIAQNQNLSVRYLEQLFSELKNAGLVTSIRGVKGGYMLTRAPEEIFVSDILLPLEGDVSPVGCQSGGCECNDPENCLTKPLWEHLHNSVYEIMEHTSLKDLIEREK